MMQREGERLAYLQALGITQYVPVRPVPGALELPVLEWNAATPEFSTPAPQPEPVADAPAIVEEIVAAAVAATEVKEPAAKEIPKLDLSRVKLDDAPARTTPIKPATLQRFTLAVVTIPQRMRLLVELSQPDAPGLSALEFRLLSDILLALRSQFELNDGNTKLFRWPLVNNPRITADASAARDALLAFLAAAQTEQPQVKNLFLGAAPLLCFPHQKLGEVFSLPELDSNAGAAQCLVTHSLSAMQQDWTLKAPVWSHLRAFL